MTRLWLFLLLISPSAGCSGSPRALSGVLEIRPGSEQACFEQFDLPSGGRIEWSWLFKNPETRINFPDQVLIRVYVIPGERAPSDVVAGIRKGEIPPARTLPVSASGRRGAEGFEVLRRPGTVVLEWINDNPSAPLQVQWSVSIRDGAPD